METAETYLDYAAATPVAPEVLEAMLPWFSERFHNPSAPYGPGRAARAALDDSKSRIARLMGAKVGNITLTAGATEANNLAFAAADGSAAVAATEHDSVLARARAREHVLVDVDAQGFVAPAALEAVITPQTGVVSIALANGEIGTVQRMRELAEVVRRERARRLEAGEGLPILLHTDASQAAGALSVNVSSIGADLVTVSAAKIYGPKQVGLLWAADGIALRPLVLGGGQEGGVRSGTENVAGAVGFARAFELACGQRKEEARRIAGLRNRLQAGLLAEFPWAVVSGPRKDRDRLPGLLNISFPGLQARRLVILLEKRGVLVGTGSACAASKMRTSHVLQAIGLPQDAADGSLRITFGRPSTKADAERALEAIVQVVRSERERLAT